MIHHSWLTYAKLEIKPREGPMLGRQVPINQAHSQPLTGWFNVVMILIRLWTTNLTLRPYDLCDY